MNRLLVSVSIGLLCLAGTALCPAARADEVTVASAGPLSGPQAVFGVSWQNGMKLYFEQVNKAGGVAGHTFKLMQLDDKADPREGTLVAQKACEDDSVIALLGHFNSGVTLAAAHAKRVAPWVAGGEIPEELPAFRGGRFLEPGHVAANAH